MKTLIYLLQVSACTGIFYLFYFFVLRRLTFFTINRWYLLSTLLLSFSIPLITIPQNVIPETYSVSNVPFSRVIPLHYSTSAQATSQLIANSDISFNWISLLPFGYFMVTGILIGIFLFSITVFLKRIKSKQIVQSGNVKILKGTGKYRNGSFLNYVFINEEGLTSEEIEQIIAHEMVHAEQMHSIDILFAKIVKSILWFNPFAYGYFMAIAANHEYEVDEQVARNRDKASYAGLILRLVTSGEGVAGSYFSKHPLRTRIAMLFNEPTKTTKKIFYVLVLPLILLSILFFAHREFAQTKAIQSPLAMRLVADGSDLSKASPKSESVPQKLIGLVKIMPPILMVDTIEDLKINLTPNSEPKALTNPVEKAKPVVPIDILASLEKSRMKVSKEYANSSTYDFQTSYKHVVSRTSPVNTEGCGPDPLVLIDGIEYDASILEKISKNCIAGSAIYDVKYAVEMYGGKAKDGLVKIRTRWGKITYASEIERDNLVKLNTVPAANFYTRLRLRNEDGSFKNNDEIIINHPLNGKVMSSDILSTEKAAFILDGKVYNEEQIVALNRSIKITGGSRGLGGPENFPEYKDRLTGYSVVFYVDGRIDDKASK